MNRAEPILRNRRGYTLRFDPQSHEYRLTSPQGEERTLPSVTRILSLLGKPRLQAWAMDLMAQHILNNYAPGMTHEELLYLTQEAAGLHRKEARSAANTGSEVHDWIEAFLGGIPRSLPQDPKAQRAVERFLEWWETTPRRFLLSEEIVAHPPLGYAGKVDLVLSDRTLVDFKTSKALYPEYALQLGGYALALEWWEGLRPQKGLLVRIGKDGSFETQEVDLPRAREAFLHLLEVWKYLETR
ncbi:PD-(D/E)XK nuclease family protein [Thermus caldilimi]|uniref:PD-(D/E)XK nuclease family protein n=1 Tax=Thermus caldilimi TaxID=2483360 RepID=UPI001F10D750|nr:PD-(D/E)XK nuclease family protein [Thermus caldilimi]